jgi:hypothetical protein
VNLDLAATPGSNASDGQLDRVTVNGTGSADVISISASGGNLLVSGLPAQVTADHADPTDQLIINGLGGNDFITSSSSLNIAFGDQGDDQLFFVGNQNQLFGGDGNDWLGISGINNVLVGGTEMSSWAQPAPAILWRARMAMTRYRRLGTAMPCMARMTVTRLR